MMIFSMNAYIKTEQSKQEYLEGKNIIQIHDFLRVDVNGNFQNGKTLRKILFLSTKSWSVFVSA